MCGPLDLPFSFRGCAAVPTRRVESSILDQGNWFARLAGDVEVFGDKPNFYAEAVMILIVDDNPDLAETCSIMLGSSGHYVQVVHSAREAISKIASHHPDLVISDCCMPEMTGLQLSEFLRSAPGSCALPILLMSGAPEREVATGKSYDAFIKKPFLAETLLAQVRNLLRGSAAAPELVGRFA